ncbi:MAG: phage head closure protein [Rikenellaceae bacterium]
MYDTLIEIKKQSEELNELNERIDKFEHVGNFYAQKTESGGRENLFASRIVNENEVVFTIRYTEQVKAGMFVVYDERIMQINSKVPEGRRFRLHLKCTESDVESLS